MSRERSRTRPVRNAVLAAVAVLVASSAPAQAAAARQRHHERGQSASAELTSGPFAITFDAHRAARAPADAATGSFIAHMTAGPLALMTLQGPVTCLDVQGDRVGLFYPITGSSPALLSMIDSGVFIYAQRNPNGSLDVGFLPVPFSHTASCAPSAAPLPATGTLSLS